jgi:carbon monoxide dehydrogenase subunit G
MEIQNRFEVDASPERVWETLVDLERVGPAIPGAEIGAAGADGAHPAEIVVKLGPMRMTYAGTVRIVERDDAARRAVLSADVKEARGQGTARATMTMRVEGDARPALVDSTTEVQLTGRVASMGRGIIDDVATRLVGQMSENLTAQLAPPAPVSADPAPAPAPARPVNGIGLLLAVLRERIRRLLTRGR